MRSVIIALLVATFATAARAQANSEPSPFNDDQVRRVLLIALENITRVPCGSQPCPATTEDEKKNPPLTIMEARSIMHRGLVSSVGKFCDLDWQKRNFEPMMEYWRQQKKNVRQMALVAMVHGIMQGIASPKSSTCTNEMRRNIDAQLSFR